MEFNVVSRSVPRVDGLTKVLGQARYAEDFKIENICYGRFVRSRIAHGLIKKLDVSQALALKGVVTIYLPEEAPLERMGGMINDRYLLPRDGIVRYVGDPIAVVVAETADIADEAVRLVEIEYEERPAVFNVKEAFRQHPTVVIHPDLKTYKIGGTIGQITLEPDLPNCAQHVALNYGDIEKGFAAADVIIENEFTLPRVSHCMPETHQCTAWWDAGDNLTMVASSQGISPFQVSVAALCHIPTSKVRIISPYKGAGFGAILNPNLVHIVPLVARKAGRPVKMSFSREEQFVGGIHRAADVVQIKDGVKNDGRITARQVKVLMDVGAYASQALGIVWFFGSEVTAAYKIPNVKCDSYGVFTNLPLSGGYRGFSGPELAWGIEQQMDIIAGRLGVNPIEFRKINLLGEGDTDCAGRIVHSTGARETLELASRSVAWGIKEQTEYPWKTGTGVSLGYKGTAGNTTSNALVRIKADGFIEVYHSAAETGQGVDTVVSQIAAEEFNTGMDAVRVITRDTAITPWEAGSFSSRNTFHLGNAVIKACRDAKRQLFDLAASLLGSADLDIKNGIIYRRDNTEKFVPLISLFAATGAPAGGNNIEIIGHGSFCGRTEGGAIISCAYAAHVAQVAVNIETGEIKILKLAVIGDCGRPINPKMVEQQLEGGMVQGIGPALTEILLFEKGKTLNPRFRDYRVPQFSDIPPVKDFTTAIVSVLHREGPYGAKGVGEVSVVPAAPAVANAVFDAVGVRIKNLPISRERLFFALEKSGGKKPG